MNRFPIMKQTGTHADLFAAVGLADLLATLATKCRLEDEGHSFVVLPGKELMEADVERLGQSPGYDFLHTKGELPKGVAGHLIFDYPAQKAKADRRKVAHKQAKLAGVAMAQELDEDKPHPDWRLYQVLNTLQGDGGTNKFLTLMLRESPESWRRIVWQSLEKLRQGREPELDWDIDLVQLFNPHAAKGYSRLKPDSTGRGDKSKDSWARPFLEWLRFRGYFRSACPYFLGPKSEHVRLLCPEPRSIGLRMYERVVQDLRASPIFGSAPKIDCLGTLKLAQLLIERSPKFLGGYASPASLIHAVTIVQYQSMGNAKAITSMERLALPGWFDLNTEEDAGFWNEALTEHSAILRSLNDKNSDEIGMLLQYRRFLESGSQQGVRELLVFMEQYGIFLLRQRARSPQWRHRQFQTRHLERMLMADSTYNEVLKNPGFQAVSGALRSATVSAQSLKRNKRDYREIRYDILPELRRKRALPGKHGMDAFLQAISEFIASYNAESARRLELNKKSGIKRITTAEIEAFLGLFHEEKNASLIGALLCAYATCRDVQEELPEETGETITTEAENE